MHSIKSLGLIARQMHHPESDDLQSGLFETPEDFTDEIFLNSIGLNNR
jgi:hypothetical protein